MKLRKNKKILFRKYMKFLFAVVMVLNMSLHEGWNIRAQEEGILSGASIQVSYMQENAIVYRIRVGVTGDGEVRYEKDRKQYTIRNETVGILLESYNSITFTLVSDDGVEVKSILLNGEPLNNSIIEITINGSDGAQTLEVEFEEQENTLIESIGNTIFQGQQIIVPNTGVSMSSYVGKACFISLCICMYLYQERRSILD